MGKGFQVYKGLQKPLIYKGFQGKFIYYGIAVLLSALVVGAVLIAAVNMYLGVTVMTLILACGFFYLASKQKKGLHAKNRLSGIFIHSPKITSFHGKKTGV